MHGVRVGFADFLGRASYGDALRGLETRRSRVNLEGSSISDSNENIPHHCLPFLVEPIDSGSAATALLPFLIHIRFRGNSSNARSRVSPVQEANAFARTITVGQNRLAVLGRQSTDSK